MTVKVGVLPYDRAWGVLFGASICMFCAVPAVIYYTFGLFVSEIIADTGWSAASVAAAIGPAALLGACLGPLIGRLSDKVGVRPVALVGGPLFGAGIALVGWGSTSAASFSVFTIIMFVFAAAGSPIPYAQALTGWFDRRRGLALAIMFCVGAIGIAAWPLYAAMLIAEMGWREAYIAMGATAGGLIFLSAVLFLRNAPRDYNPDGTSNIPEPSGMVLKEALCTSRFWKMAAIFFILTAVLGGMAVELPVVLRQQGADAQAAARIVSVIGIFMFVGRVLLGFILDRLFAPHVTIGIAIVSLLAFILLLSSASSIALNVAAAFLGFGIGTEYAMAAYMTSRAFGFRSYGTIYGMIALATGFGAALGPATIGVALVTDISTSWIFGGAIILLVGAILLLMSMKHHDFPYVVEKK